MYCHPPPHVSSNHLEQLTVLTLARNQLLPVDGLTYDFTVPTANLNLLDLSHNRLTRVDPTRIVTRNRLLNLQALLHLDNNDIGFIPVSHLGQIQIQIHLY
jgi:Leucine-rich repeat (LRR) protein